MGGPACAVCHDRDEGAAKNIRGEGLRQLTPPAQSLPGRGREVMHGQWPARRSAHGRTAMVWAGGVPVACGMRCASAPNEPRSRRDGRHALCARGSLKSKGLLPRLRKEALLRRRSPQVSVMTALMTVVRTVEERVDQRQARNIDGTDARSIVIPREAVVEPVVPCSDVHER